VILTSIKLHNFMSHADTFIDWRSVHVACLTGANGAGKSAILDAITWALWESARASSDQLIRLGQTEMWVDLRFSIAGEEYRVRRSRSRNSPKPGGKLVSRGTLELQMLQIGRKAKQSAPGINPMRSVTTENVEAQTPSGGTRESTGKERWISLTAPTMRETQTRICELLKMQYDTFINSVYLRQGRSDEFTQKSAGDRKEVLGEILGLKYFDRLQDLAREEARQRKARIEQLQSALPDLLSLEQDLGTLKEKLSTVNESIDEVTQSVSTYQVQAADLRQRLEQSRQAEKTLLAARKRLSEVDEDLLSISRQCQELGSKDSKFDKLLSNASHLDAEQTRFSQLSEEVQALDKKALAVHDLLDSRQHLRSALAGDKGRLEVELDHMREQVVEVNARRKKLQRDTRDRKKIQSDYHDYKRLLAEEALLNQQQEQHATLLSRAEHLHSLITEARMRLDSDVTSKESLLEELKALLASKGTLESEQQSLLGQSKELDRVDAEFSLVEERGLRIKSEIESLQSEIRELRRRCQENQEKKAELQHQPHSSTCPLCASPIVDRAAVAQRYGDQIAAFQREIADLEISMASCEDERSKLRNQYTELRNLLIVRKQLDQKIGEYNEKQAAICRAEGSLATTTVQLQRLRERLEQQEYAQVERESLINIKAELHKLDFDPIIYANVESQLRSQRHAEIRYHQLQRDLQALDEVDEHLPALEERAADYARQLRDNSFAPDIRSQLTEVESAMSSHQYDQSRHSLAREQLLELMPSVEQFRELAVARSELPALKERQRELEATSEAKATQRQRLAEDIAALQAACGDEERLVRALDALTETLEGREKARVDLLEHRGALVFEVEQRHRDLEALSGKQGELKQIIDEMNDFLQLAEALGKKGIQALIIENAIPELESEANHILSRLSENRMHVGLVTQQRTKQDTAVETLDIVIADDVGTRNYELFSGGEAFKVNFALRLALSRLLARRAGARLETLIIDEGFGTQDEDSRHRLLNAINMVSPDFARIVVVSHIAEVRQMFSTQIHVEKEGGISIAQILH
jgi:exonuclease SbcC